MTSTDADAAVDAAVALCEKNRRGLPKKAGINNVLTFSAQTASVQELILYLRYQAARHPESRIFYTDLAHELESIDDGLGAVRRYLRLVKQAAYIEIAKQESPAERRPSGARSKGGSKTPRKQGQKGGSPKRSQPGRKGR
jgi:hypothetical protein